MQPSRSHGYVVSYQLVRISIVVAMPRLGMQAATGEATGSPCFACGRCCEPAGRLLGFVGGPLHTRKLTGVLVAVQQHTQPIRFLARTWKPPGAHVADGVAHGPAVRLGLEHL